MFIAGSQTMVDMDGTWSIQGGATKMTVIVRFSAEHEPFFLALAAVKSVNETCAMPNGAPTSHIKMVRPQSQGHWFKFSGKKPHRPKSWLRLPFYLRKQESPFVSLSL